MSQISEGNAIKRPTLHHINLKTTRLQEMIDWYATVVGMSPTYQFPGGVWLTNDPDKLAHAGIHHSAFEYATIDDLLDTYMRLKGQGIEPHACLDHGMTTSFYYVIPTAIAWSCRLTTSG